MTFLLLSMLKKITVEPGMLLFYFGIYFLYTAFQPLIYQRTCEDYVRSINSTNSCQELYTWNDTTAVIKISRDASHWIRYTSICFSVPSLVIDILLGSWSDYFGRKLPMILPGIGQALATIIYISVSLVTSMHVFWFCIASTISGLFGGPTATIAGMFSYVTSDSSDESRSTRFSILQSMTYISGVLAPFIAGAIMGVTNFTTIFSISGAFFLGTSIYCSFLKDTGSRKKKVENCGELFTPRHFLDSIKTVIKPRSNRAQIIILVIAYFIDQIIKVGELDIMYLFLTDNLKYSVSQFSYFFSYKFGMGTLAVLVFLPLAKHLKVPDYLICTIGLVCKIIALILFGLSKDTVLAAVSGVFDGFGEWAITSYQALLSKSVPEHEVGKLFGIISFTGDIALLLGALIFNSLYPELKPYHPGATYFIGAGLILISLTLLIVSGCLDRGSSADHDQVGANSEKPIKNSEDKNEAAKRAAAFSNQGFDD